MGKWLGVAMKIEFISGFSCISKIKDMVLSRLPKGMKGHVYANTTK